MKTLARSELKDRVAIVVGTRPGIVKMSPIVHECVARGLDHFLLHTGQHYSYEMDRQFFEDLDLPAPLHRVADGAPGAMHGEQTARMLVGIEKALLQERPRVVLVCGDANTNLAAGLAARKLHMEVGHVEAGLRSHDWRMPEEHNRVILDHISEYLFAPTEETAQNLARDGVRGRVVVTGNTVVDALYHIAAKQRENDAIFKALKIEPAGYLVVTVHREETTDSRACLAEVVSTLQAVADEFGMPLLWPVHPRSRQRLSSLGMLADLEHGNSRFRLIEPLGYIDFIKLLSGAACCLTDSGGLQEEACSLRVPCVTLRNSTERPESIQVGANRLAGTGRAQVVAALRGALDSPRDWQNPYGDGHAAKRIIDALGARSPLWDRAADLGD